MGPVATVPLRSRPRIRMAPGRVPERTGDGICEGIGRGICLYINVDSRDSRAYRGNCYYR